MNPDMQLLLAEIQKLAAEQSTIQKQLLDQKDHLERPFIEVDASLDKCFEDADASIECHIIDSELRQDSRLAHIEQAASEFNAWCQETEGIIDDLQLRIGKLDKYWNCSKIDATVKPTLILEPPVKSEQIATRPPAGFMAARPNRHHVDNHHQENEHEVVTTLTQSPVIGMADSSSNHVKLHSTA